MGKLCIAFRGTICESRITKRPGKPRHAYFNSWGRKVHDRPGLEESIHYKLSTLVRPLRAASTEINVCLRVVWTMSRDEIAPNLKILSQCKLKSDLRTGTSTTATLRTPFNCQESFQSPRLIRITVRLRPALTLRFGVLQMLNCSCEYSKVVIEVDGTSPRDEFQYQKKTSEYNRLGFCKACQ